MKAKFMFFLICVAAVTLTACEEYPYGYYSHGSSPMGITLRTATAAATAATATPLGATAGLRGGWVLAARGATAAPGAGGMGAAGCGPGGAMGARGNWPRGSGQCGGQAHR